MALGYAAAALAACIVSAAGVWDFGRDLDYWHVAPRPGPAASLEITWDGVGDGCLLAAYREPGEAPFAPRVMVRDRMRLQAARYRYLCVDASFDTRPGAPPQPIAFGFRDEQGRWRRVSPEAFVWPVNAGRCVKVVDLAGAAPGWGGVVTAIELRLGGEFAGLEGGACRLYHVELLEAGAHGYSWPFTFAEDGFIARDGCQIEHEGAAGEDGQLRISRGQPGDTKGSVVLGPGTSVPLRMNPAAPAHAVIKARLAQPDMARGYGQPFMGEFLAFLRGGGQLRVPFGMAPSEGLQRVVLDLSQTPGWTGWAAVESVGLRPFTEPGAAEPLYLTELTIGRTASSNGPHLWDVADEAGGWNFAPPLGALSSYARPNAVFLLGGRAAPAASGPGVWNLSLRVDAEDASKLYMEYCLEATPDSAWNLEVRWDGSGQRRLGKAARAFPLPVTGPEGGQLLLDLGEKAGKGAPAFEGVISALHLAPQPAQWARGNIIRFEVGRLAMAGDADRDEDKLPDYVELFQTGTNPLSWDTDGDTLPDGWEVRWFLDPLSAEGEYGKDGDPDGDGADNEEEYKYGSDPQDYDSSPLI